MARKEFPMPESASRLSIQREGDVTVIRFNDRNILDEASIQAIGEEILRHVEASPGPRILIDFTHVDHLSSAALGTLITVNNKVRQKDGQLRLCNIDPQIYEVFVITKLNKLFQIHKSAQDAMGSFR
jgi:anti-sigma B factor antagonist